ncbi:LacI family DNA-binding transcriptional regulator [Microbacterium sp. NPDC055903]
MTDQPAGRRRPTIMEVAALAGVSHQTVSRFFRDNASLKTSTRQSVAAAVTELGYRPNPAARSMRTKQTGRLAVVVPTLAFSPARVLAGASATAHANGFAIDVLSVEGGAEERTARTVELADSGQVDGILSIAPLTSEIPETAVPVHVSAGYDDQMRGIAELTDASPIGELVHGLAALGHTRLLHITGALEFASARARSAAFQAVVDATEGIDGEVAEGDWTAECGIAAVRRLPEHDRPTAIIAGNDLIAAGVLRGARERGWQVPHDLSVTGWDCQPIGQFMHPALTTVDVDHELLGATAMTGLIAVLRGGDGADTPSLITAERPLNRTIWRESTGPAPARVAARESVDGG